MTPPVEAPRRGAEVDHELDALIEEARRRVRRRRLGYVAIVAGVLAIGGAVYLGFGGNGGGAIQGRPSQGGHPFGGLRSSQARALAQATPCSSPGRTLSGDVDGDGKPDLVRMTAKPNGRGCSYGIVAHTADGPVAVKLGTRWPTHGKQPEAPTLDRLVRLSPGHGLYVVVNMGRFGREPYVNLFAVRGQKFVDPMDVQLIPPLGVEGMDFPYSERSMDLVGVNCVRGAGQGVIVASNVLRRGGHRGKHLQLVRNFFHVQGSKLTGGRLQQADFPLGTQTVERLSRAYPEFGGHPFSNCAG
jgi:hypothetical protein